MSKRETVPEIREDFLAQLTGVTKRGNGWMGSCPVLEHGKGRRDQNPSLGVDEAEDRLLVNCLAGCPTKLVLETIGWKMDDLYPQSNGRAAFQVKAEDVTLEAYAEKTGLPVEFLEKLGLAESKYRGRIFVKIPYPDALGGERATRYRVALEKGLEGADPRFKWKTGSKTSLYGLDQLRKIEEAGYVVLAEGESDQQTFRYHDISALGIPGVDTWRDEWAEHLEGVEKVYVVIEPDEAGSKLEEKLCASPLKDKLFLIYMHSYKDPNEMYKADPENFKAEFGKAMRNAVPYEEREREQVKEAAADYWKECEDLAKKEDILAEFEKDVRTIGVVGQEREAKIIYLASHTRHFDTPTSIVIKGLSSGGKSHTLYRVLDFQPEEAYYKLSAMSDKALAHFDQPLKHRHLVIAEAAALDSSEMATYLVRTLLSEGHLHYIYPLPTPDGIELHEVQVEGPTGLFITTTQTSLHNENETRLLSLSVNDTEAQTKAVMRGTVEKRRRKRRGETDQDLTDRWHALARWIALAGIKKAHIPYDEWLADEIPPVAVRLRRDFEQVLNLVEAHAILHQANREVNEWGEIIATIDDYRVVRALMADLLSEQLEASVPPIVRETVDKIQDLMAEKHEDEEEDESVSAVKLRQKLGLDKNATARRLRMAIDRGYVKNLEDRKGKPGRYVSGDPLPEDAVVLPLPDKVPEDLGGCTTVSSDSSDQEGAQNTFPVSEHEEERKVFEGDSESVGTLGTAVHFSSEDNKVFKDPTRSPESLETVRCLSENETCLHEVKGGCHLCRKNRQSPFYEADSDKYCEHSASVGHCVLCEESLGGERDEGEGGIEWLS